MPRRFGLASRYLNVAAIALGGGCALAGATGQHQDSPAPSPSPRAASPSPLASSSPSTSPSASPSPASHDVPALERLGSADPAERAHAAQDLAIAPLTAEQLKAVLPRLAAAADSAFGRATPGRELDIRRAAARALGKAGGARIDSAVVALADALRSDTDMTVREESAHALAEAGHSPATVEALLGALVDKNASVRREVVTPSAPWPRRCRISSGMTTWPSTTTWWWQAA